MKKEVLFAVIDHLYEFDSEHQHSEYAIEDFLGYLNARIPQKDIEIRKVGGEKEAYIQDLRKANHSDIAILITTLFRYAKGYIKQALQNSNLQTSDEFTFLLVLMTFDSLTKMELINKQVMEKASGIEVLKRLKNKKMIREFDDEADKRKVRVAITDIGKTEIQKVLPEMVMVSRVVAGNLTDPEIHTLSYLLKKLDFYHHNIFMDKNNLSLSEILDSNK